MELNQKCQHTKPLKNGYTQKVNKETKHSNNSNFVQHTSKQTNKNTNRELTIHNFLMNKPAHCSEKSLKLSAVSAKNIKNNGIFTKNFL